MICFSMIAHVATDNLTFEQIEEMHMERGRLLHEGNLSHAEKSNRQRIIRPAPGQF